MTELGFHWPSLLAYLVNFLLLLGILYAFGYKRILGMLDQRSERIRDSLAEAEKTREGATQAGKEIEERLADANLEGQRVLAEARDAATAYREQQQAQARDEADLMISRARNEIRTERDAALEQLRNEFAGLAVTAAERIIHRSLDANTHRDLIDEVLTESDALREQR